MEPSILIDEHLDERGEPRPTFLAAPGDGSVVLIEGGERRALPERAVAVVMRRYGRELAPGVEPDGERLAIGELGELERLRFHAVVDAEGRDYLVWREPGRAPLAALGRQAAAALRHLAAAA